MTQLPRDIEQWEQENHMPCITSIERLASEKGLIAGKIQMRQRFLSDVVESSEALLSQSTEELDGK